MSVIRVNFGQGVIANNPLLIGDLTLSSAYLAGFPAVVAPDIARIVLDPNGDFGLPEIVHITNHAALSTSATIVRAQEVTVARQHPQGATFRNAVTAADLNELATVYAKHLNPPVTTFGASTTRTVDLGSITIPASWLTFTALVRVSFSLIPDGGADRTLTMRARYNGVNLNQWAGVYRTYTTVGNHQATVTFEETTGNLAQTGEDTFGFEFELSAIDAGISTSKVLAICQAFKVS